jgi:hypothetical protein
MTIPLDPMFIPAFSIEDVLLDKDTGAPLSGGLVYFEQDNQRGVLKAVYQITGTSPNYSFIQLPNPMTLSSIGTFEDSMQNPIIPYFYPYDASGDVELYYVRVTSSEDVEQFTREAVPYIGSGGDASVITAFENEISNPQFAEVLFPTTTSSYVYSFNAASSQVVDIAPDWAIVVSSVAAATVTVSQLTPTGSLNISTNPGTILNINSSGVSSLRLRQRIYGSPNLWGSGFLSGTFIAKTYNGSPTTLKMYYSQSNGAVVDEAIVTAILPASGEYAAYPGSIEIPASTSAQDFPDAYIDIYFDIPSSIQVDISSVMVASTGQTAVTGIIYDQESNPRQLDHLFHYYKPQLEYKPIPSYLVGWDFPLNPSQFFVNGVTSLGATGANKSSYVWDQTIAFQTVNNVLSTARNSADNGLNITVSSSSSFALIQYIPAQIAREILTQSTAVQLKAEVSAGTLGGTVSLWWTADGALPDLKAPNYNSLVSAITAGVPTCGNRTWTQVKNLYSDSAATVSSKSSVPFILGTSALPIDFVGFSGDTTGANSATFMAIVVAFDTMPNTTTMTIEYCSLVGGDIATRPAPQTLDQVLRECEYYYEKSYDTNRAPGSNTTSGEQFEFQQANPASGSTANVAQHLIARIFSIQYRTVKRIAPTTANGTLTLYNPDGSVPLGGSVQGAIRNGGVFLTNGDVSMTNWQIEGPGTKYTQFLPNNVSNLVTSIAQVGNWAEAYITYQYVADARLGII